jgi:hypothetical protein
MIRANVSCTTKANDIGLVDRDGCKINQKNQASRNVRRSGTRGMQGSAAAPVQPRYCEYCLAGNVRFGNVAHSLVFRSFIDYLEGAGL